MASKRTVDASQVVITNGGKQAVYLACQALLDPGDEVLLPAPYWVTYPEAVGLAGGSTVPVLTDESTNFTVTVEQLDAAVTERTKMLIFVSPSNPTGAVYTAAQMKAVAAWESIVFCFQLSLLCTLPAERFMAPLKA